MQDFLILGDWGDTTTFLFQIIHAHIQKWSVTLENPPIFLSLGDQFYPQGVHDIHDPLFHQNVEKTWKFWQGPIFPVFGNHDKMRNSQALLDYHYFKKWNFPSAYYLKIISKCKMGIWFLDTCVLDIEQSCQLNVPLKTLQPDFQQLEWLEKTLDYYHSRLDYRIVIGHYPLSSCGPHGSSSFLQTFFLPLLKKYKVQLYLSGHEHNLQCISSIESNLTCIISGGSSYFHPPTATKKPISLISSQYNKWNVLFQAPFVGFWTMSVNKYNVLLTAHYVVITSETSAPSSQQVQNHHHPMSIRPIQPIWSTWNILILP